MTVKALKALPAGARVIWDGQSDIIGTIRVDGRARWIEWSDGQRTESYDDWALVHVDVPAGEQMRRPL